MASNVDIGCISDEEEAAVIGLAVNVFSQHAFVSSFSNELLMNTKAILESGEPKQAIINKIVRHANLIRWC